MSFFRTWIPLEAIRRAAKTKEERSSEAEKLEVELRRSLLESSVLGPAPPPAASPVTRTSVAAAALREQ